MHPEHRSILEAVGLPFDGGSTVGICSSCGVAAVLRFSECAECRSVGFSYDEVCTSCEREGVVNGEGLCGECEDTPCPHCEESWCDGCEDIEPEWHKDANGEWGCL